MRIIRLNYLIVVLLCSTAAIAQTKKLEETFKTDTDVTVNVDVSHINVEVDFWDRNEVAVEAYLETPDGERDQDDLEKALENWDLDLTSSKGQVTIRSAGRTGLGDIDFAQIQGPLVRLPEMMMPLQDMIGPLLEGISAAPLPPEFYESMGKIEFDYEAYQKDGEKYLKQFEKEVEKNFGKDFEKSMQKWAEKFEQDSLLKRRIIIMEEMGEDLEKSMEAWGEEFGKNMEAWGEKFGKDMEAWAKNMENQAGTTHAGSKHIRIVNNGPAAKKTILIKMPRDGQLNLNVRHGKVQLKGTVKDLTGSLSHSQFSAATISGDKTDIKIAYTPVNIKNWEYGRLNASYVQDLWIGNVKSIKLTSNSSDVTIEELEDHGIFRGTFGELVINQVSNDFSSLDIYLENSDLKLDLPETAFNINYSGNKSRVDYPEGLSVKASRSYDNQKLNGYNKNSTANATISINASFSEVVLK